MAAGEEKAYREFYDAYFNRLSRYLLVVTAGNEDVAREALQVTLVRVVRHIKVFPTDEAFWGWLTVLACSALSDQSRKERRYLAFLDRFTAHTRQQTTGDDGEADEQLQSLLWQHLAKVLPDERQLVEWKYLHRRSVREIAAELQTTEKTVESRLSRIRSKLRNAVMDGLKREPKT
jgi:RNA polymerase sigma-70 factor, ECF subfamily